MRRRLDRLGRSDRLSSAVPLVARVYPNGSGDVNQFHAAGGMAFTIATLLDAGLLHPDILTVAGDGLGAYARTPKLDGDKLAWSAAPSASLDDAILRPAGDPFSPDGGMRLVTGNLGRAIFKTSAGRSVALEQWAPARVFSDQAQVITAFQAGELDRDVVVVVRFQGPCANGMPELHKLTPALGILQDKGFKVALLTDGRMSGASGKVPAAIHLTPEALGGGPVARLRDGDLVRLSAETREIQALVDPAVWGCPRGRRAAADHAGFRPRAVRLFPLWRCRARKPARRPCSPSWTRGSRTFGLRFRPLGGLGQHFASAGRPDTRVGLDPAG